MRIILLLAFLDLIQPSHSMLDFSYWINTILFNESPANDPKPWKFEDFQSEDTVPHIRIIYHLFGEFLSNPVDDLYVPPGHRRTRECCIDNKQPKSTAPLVKPTLFQRTYKWIISKFSRDTPPPVVCRQVLMDCVGTYRARLIHGTVCVGLMSPVILLLILAVWFILSRQEDELSHQHPRLSAAKNLHINKKIVEDPPRADSKIVQGPVSRKHVRFSKAVHVRLIPPDHHNIKAPSNKEHQEREFIYDPDPNESIL